MSLHKKWVVNVHQIFLNRFSSRIPLGDLGAWLYDWYIIPRTRTKAHGEDSSKESKKTKRSVEKSLTPSTGFLHRDQHQSQHRFAISYRLKRCQNSSPQEWAPLSYPRHTEVKNKGQSHDYRTTTKGNPIQERSKSPFPPPTRAHHPIITSTPSRRRELSDDGRSRDGIGQ